MSGRKEKARRANIQRFTEAMHDALGKRTDDINEFWAEQVMDGAKLDDMTVHEKDPYHWVILRDNKPIATSDIVTDEQGIIDHVLMVNSITMEDGIVTSIPD